MTVMWTAVLVLVAVFIVLQVAGARALRSWGVSPSPAVQVLRVLNVVALVAVVVFAYWKQAS
ncbi:MAG: hypothetical protein KGZ40_02740 [Clostridiales bacterium]|nr:hypothetical protein [Clostridiales bacterium]